MGLWTARPRSLAALVTVLLTVAAGALGWSLYPAQSDMSGSSASSPQPRADSAQPVRARPSASASVPRATSSQAPSSRPTRHAKAAAWPLTDGLRLGVFAAGQSLTSFDAQVGHAALAVSYVQWGSSVRWWGRVIASAAAHLAEPILELYPGALGHDASQIASGAGGSDAWLRDLGQMIARTGDPVSISFFPEMNGPWRASWSHGPADYVRAFRHVRQILSGQAGSLITWFWQPSAMHNANPSPMPWWPGPGYADVVALDGYYYFAHDTFDAIFAATIRLVRQATPATPIMLGETAAGPMYGRQAWEIANEFAGIRSHHLVGLVWFNRSQHMPPYQFHQDWRLQDHPAALAEFRTCLARYGPLATLAR